MASSSFTLFLKDNQLEYLEETRIKDLVNKLFEFISHPIYMWTENKIGDVDEDKDKGSKIKEIFLVRSVAGDGLDYSCLVAYKLLNRHA
ncbi:hypothetical protein JHK85_024806 [Glycine max]|nr:hypothetical protein JHK85_024806 [Glycine max]